MRSSARVSAILVALSGACASDGGGGNSTGAATDSSTGAVVTTGTSTGEGSSGSSAAPTTGATQGEGTSGGATQGEGTTGGSTQGEGTSGTGSSEGGSSEVGSSEGGASEGGSSESGGLSGSELRVLQLNLCHSGVAGCFKGDAVMVKAAAVIESVAPGLVTLNEVCREDLPTLAAQTGALDFQFTPALKSDDSPVKCKNGDDYGIGLLSWSAPTWDEPVHGVYAAQSSMSERRVWICMGYTGFVGCTTHLSTNGPTALAQCEALVGGALATAAADGPALMAGDWNMKYKGDPNAQDCVPPGFYRKGDGSLQHVIASDELGFVETVIIDMDGTTDHPGLEVRVTFP